MHAAPPSSHESYIEGEMRTRAQHARVGAAFTKAIARRMSTCMAPNYLAALGPGGEQTPSQDTQKQLEKERCFGENSWAAVLKWASKATFTSSRCEVPTRDTSPLPAQRVSYRLIRTNSLPVISIDIDVNATLTSRPVIQTSAWNVNWSCS